MENSNVKKIGLTTATLMLVGTVIGSSIFIATGFQAEAMGPSVWFVFILGAIMTIPVCFQSAHIGCVLPREGATYETIKRTTGNYSAFLYGWIYIIWIAIFLPYCAHAIGKYLQVYFPDINTYVVAVIVLVTFGMVNCLGLHAAAVVQNIVVGTLIIAMLVFTFAGIPHIDTANYTPLFPYGAIPVIEQIIPSYFGFLAFFTITEWAGEVKNPQRTLPRALLYSLATVAVLYLCVSVVLCGVQNYTELGIDAPVSFVAKTLFSGPVGVFITLGALFATVSTVNGMMITVAREISTVSQSGYLPNFLGRKNKYGAPYMSIILSVIIAIILAFITDSVMAYIGVVTLFIMLNLIHSGVAMLLSKKVLREEYEAAEYKLKGIWFWIIPILVIITCSFIFVLSFLGAREMFIPILVILAVGSGIFLISSKSAK